MCSVLWSSRVSAGGSQLTVVLVKRQEFVQARRKIAQKIVHECECELTAIQRLINGGKTVIPTKQYYLALDSALLDCVSKLMMEGTSVTEMLELLSWYGYPLSLSELHGLIQAVVRS
jgi:hypothetical protein